MAGEIKLGPTGSEITLPRTGRQLHEKDIEITQEGRTISGNLVVDFTTSKKVFEIHYTAIKDADLQSIVTLYELHANLNLIITNRNATTRNYTVKFRPFNRRRWRVVGDWWWRDVMLELEEV